MTIGGYDAFDDPYAYKGTSVLKNRLKTRDAAVLAAFVSIQRVAGSAHMDSRIKSESDGLYLNTNSYCQAAPIR